ncbi:MAG: hypothetical protein PHQ93_00040 [Sulfurimonas sp.]|uniref:hypothetical protein n=1 Tax=Sulfurimonas sp. TaxID=2022749 RepID=UPI0026356741|nr:hypothetical protein [Sulfurimonas sp.]MDD5399564.1 hypothetical protein [Sulfurimonas sp.]
MLTYFKVLFILTVMFISLAVITNLFTTIKFLDFVLAFGIAVSISFFIEYGKVQSKYLLFLRKYF